MKPMDVDSEAQPVAPQQSCPTFARRTVVKALSPAIDLPTSLSLPESQPRFAQRTAVKFEVVPAQIPPPAQPIAVASSEIAPNSHPTFAKQTIVKSKPIAATSSVPLEVVPAQPVTKSQPTFAKRTVVKQVANPPLPLASSGVNPALPFTIPHIDVPKSEVGQQSQPSFLRRIVVKLPVIAPPPPLQIHQDVNPPARMDVDNTSDNMSSEEIPPRTAPITFARRKVANLPCTCTPAPNNAVPGTTGHALEVDHAPPPSQTQPQCKILADSVKGRGAPSTSSWSPLEFTPIERYKLLPPSVSPISRTHRDLSSVSPQPVIPDWLGTRSLQAIVAYYDQADPSPASIQNPTFCQLDASGSSHPAPADLDEMIASFTTLHRLPDSHVPKSVQTIPQVSIPASEDKGIPTG
ncbi:hypothetical protein JAAARDRAFT_200519 [Jaapia argillacea MUCL 33604]|uniref:Uncharacterized protein n=1 Tax=Jaapia argillacea MUCL 33604 TaxID=933084 RepID=A0A067P7L5_9AGAM|nr:hypothetical protein JAAARDRAFT_200519 [Jaapia argillacea MUCL 33604]